MIEERIKSIITEILDIDNLDSESDIVRDLGAESIDMLEIALSLEKEFSIKVDENRLFLKSVRFYIDEAKQKSIDAAKYIKEKYPFLSEERIKELIAETQLMPSVKIKDIVSYVKWMLGAHNKEQKKHKEV